VLKTAAFQCFTIFHLFIAYILSEIYQETQKYAAFWAISLEFKVFSTAREKVSLSKNSSCNCYNFFVC